MTLLLSWYKWIKNNSCHDISTVFSKVKNIAKMTLNLNKMTFLSVKKCLYKMQTVWQTVQTLIRLSLWQQSDLGLHYLLWPICPKKLENNGRGPFHLNEPSFETTCFMSVSKLGKTQTRLLNNFA